MPHFIVECTDNLKDSARLPELFDAVHGYLAGTGIFPIGGIRSRAHWLETWRMADGERDYAFVHMTLKIGAGRDEATQREVAQGMFAMIQSHFAALASQRLLALSFELTELHPTLNFKQNNVHALFTSEH